MDCRTCRHRWCWVCGSDLSQSFHKNFMEPACAMINLFVLHEKIPNFLRYPMAIIAMILCPPIVLFFCLCHLGDEFIRNKFDIHPTWSYRSRRLSDKSKKKKCLNVLFCSTKTGYRIIRYLSNLFIATPFWILFWVFIISMSTIIWAITILPAYLYAIFSLAKCMAWWCKNKKVNTYDLTDE